MAIEIHLCQWEIHLYSWWIFQPAMLVYRRVPVFKATEHRQANSQKEAGSSSNHGFLQDFSVDGRNPANQLKFPFEMAYFQVLWLLVSRH